ncbi:hypothetical protein TB1_022217 [Malus domestica]
MGLGLVAGPTQLDGHSRPSPLPLPRQVGTRAQCRHRTPRIDSSLAWSEPKSLSRLLGHSFTGLLRNVGANGLGDRVEVRELCWDWTSH